MFHEKSLDETKGDELIICGNVNEIDKRFKENKITEEKNGILENFHMVGIIDMDGKLMVQLIYLWNILYLVANLVVLPKFRIVTVQH